MPKIREAKVPNTIVGTTLRPSFGEFKDFSKYIEDIEKKKLNFVKVIPPTEYSAGSGPLPKEYVLRRVVHQTTEKLGSSFEISYDKQKTMTFGEFGNNIKRETEEYNSETLARYEDEFWESLNSEEERPYAIENDISLFAQQCKHWNLNRFTSKESLIHGHETEMPGISRPYLYVGSRLSVFGLHQEDGNLNSINYNHCGSPKIWYFVPEEESEKLERLVNSLGIAKYKCTFYIRHKCVLVPPSVLKSHGIRFTRIIQYPGEFVVSFSGAYHQGFNLGLNLAEAVNFGTRRWLSFVTKFQMCQCQNKEKKLDRFTLTHLQKIANLHLQLANEVDAQEPLNQPAQSFVRSLPNDDKNDFHWQSDIDGGSRSSTESLLLGFDSRNVPVREAKRKSTDNKVGSVHEPQKRLKKRAFRLKEKCEKLSTPQKVTEMESTAMRSTSTELNLSCTADISKHVSIAVCETSENEPQPSSPKKSNTKNVRLTKRQRESKCGNDAKPQKNEGVEMKLDDINVKPMVPNTIHGRNEHEIKIDTMFNEIMNESLNESPATSSSLPSSSPSPSSHFISQPQCGTAQKTDCGTSNAKPKLLKCIQHLEKMKKGQIRKTIGKSRLDLALKLTTLKSLNTNSQFLREDMKAEDEKMFANEPEPEKMNQIESEPIASTSNVHLKPNNDCLRAENSNHNVLLDPYTNTSSDVFKKPKSVATQKKANPTRKPTVRKSIEKEPSTISATTSKESDEKKKARKPRSKKANSVENPDNSSEPTNPAVVVSQDSNDASVKATTKKRAVLSKRKSIDKTEDETIESCSTSTELNRTKDVVVETEPKKNTRKRKTSSAETGSSTSTENDKSGKIGSAKRQRKSNNDAKKQQNESGEVKPSRSRLTKPKLKPTVDDVVIDSRVKPVVEVKPNVDGPNTLPQIKKEMLNLGCDRSRGYQSEFFNFAQKKEPAEFTKTQMNIGLSQQPHTLKMKINHEKCEVPSTSRNDTIMGPAIEHTAVDLIATYSNAVNQADETVQQEPIDAENLHTSVDMFDSTDVSNTSISPNANKDEPKSKTEKSSVERVGSTRQRKSRCDTDAKVTTEQNEDIKVKRKRGRAPKSETKPIKIEQPSLPNDDENVLHWQSDIDGGFQESESTQKKQIQCDKCDRKYRSAKSLSKHKRLEHSDVPSKFKCPMCESILGQAHTLKEHLRDVHHEKMEIQNAKDHRVQVTQELCVKTKVSNKWKKEPTLKCDKCGQKCKGRSNMKRHFKTMHSSAEKC